MNDIESPTVKINRLAAAVASVISEASEKKLASNEMRIEIDTGDTEGSTQVYSGLTNKGIYGSQYAIYFSGPLSFVDLIRYDRKFKTVDQKEKAIAKLETTGLDIDGDEYDAEEQAYLPGSLKISKKGEYKIYDFKIKSKFAKASVLKKIKVSYSQH
jgi:hypothetical protein